MMMMMMMKGNEFKILPILVIIRLSFSHPIRDLIRTSSETIFLLTPQQQQGQLLEFKL